MMKKFILILTLIISFTAISCENEKIELSSIAKLYGIDFKIGSSIYSTEIDNDAKEIIFQQKFPSDTKEIEIYSLRLPSGASADKKTGEIISLKGTETITVTAENGKNTISYALNYSFRSNETIVKQHGLLKVSGNRIVNKDDKAVSLAGNSFFWCNDGWGGEKFYNETVVSWLKDDWNTTIVRAAMGVQESGGYLDNKTGNLTKLKKVIDAAIAEGLYVIIDWHSHHAEDNLEEAKEFFGQMAEDYGSYENVIYEIYNEPLDVSWDNVIKPYAEEVIGVIRAKDPDNLIVVGTPNWSQDVEKAAENPITKYNNIAYVLHFYTVHHQKWLRDKADIALNKGIALFITEWGSIGYTQDDPETEAWMQWCKDNHISHCNWAVNDKEEEWSIVKPGASTTGNWSASELTEAGKLAKTIISGWPEY